MNGSSHTVILRMPYCTCFYKKEENRIRATEQNWGSTVDTSTRLIKVVNCKNINISKAGEVEVKWSVASQRLPIVVASFKSLWQWCPVTLGHAAELKMLCTSVSLVQSAVCLCLCGPEDSHRSAVVKKQRPGCVSIESGWQRQLSYSWVLYTCMKTWPDPPPKKVVAEAWWWTDFLHGELTG